MNGVNIIIILYLLSLGKLEYYCVRTKLASQCTMPEKIERYCICRWL